MRTKLFLVGLILLGMTSVAHADGTYVSVAGGVSVFHDADMSNGELSRELSTLGFRSASASYDTGYGASLAAGYISGPLRVEGEFGYKRADADKLTIGVAVADVAIPIDSTDMTIMSYMANVYYDFKNSSSFVPYVGLGLGIINGKLDLDGYTLKDTVWGYQLMTGLEIPVSANTSFDLSYRYQAIGDDFEKEGTKLEYSSSNIMAGLRFKF